MRWRPEFPLAAVAVLLAACSADPPRALLADYLYRLGNSLQQLPPEPVEQAALLLPAQRELRIRFPRQTIGLLELFDLQDCRLHTLVAHRNSSLGKVAPASQQLVYELRFLELAHECIEQLAATEPELTDYLQQVLASKREQLPQRIFAATLGAPEWRQFWRRPHRLGDYPAQTSSRVLESIDYLSNRVEAWLQGAWQVDGQQLELHLQRLARGDGGQLLAAWRLLAQQLGVGTAMARQRAAGQPLCHAGIANRQGQILATVMQNYFAARVQPWAARLNQRRYQLWPAVQRLEQLLADAAPVPYSQWAAARDRQLRADAAAVKTHVEALQPLLRQCGLLPGS